MECDETTEVRTTNVHPLERIDRVLQREVKPRHLTHTKARSTVCTKPLGPSPQPPNQVGVGSNTHPPNQVPSGLKQSSGSPNLAKYRKTAENYLGRFESMGQMTQDKPSTTSNSVRNPRKDRSSKIKKHATSGIQNNTII
jgi:hypothetical protein